MAYQAMIPVMRLGSGSGMPVMTRMPEAATQTFKRGTPVTLVAGVVTACAFGGGPELVYGVSSEDGANLTVAATPETLSVGTPDNQASAKIIPVGAPMNDGKCGVYLADDFNVFEMSLLAAQVFTDALVTNDRYTMVKDATSGFWYIDSTGTGTDDEDCVHILGGNPNDTTKVRVKFAAAARFHA